MVSYLERESMRENDASGSRNARSRIKAPTRSYSLPLAYTFLLAATFCCALNTTGPLLPPQSFQAAASGTINPALSRSVIVHLSRL